MNGRENPYEPSMTMSDQGTRATLPWHCLQMIVTALGLGVTSGSILVFGEAIAQIVERGLESAFLETWTSAFPEKMTLAGTSFGLFLLTEFVIVRLVFRRQLLLTRFSFCYLLLIAPIAGLLLISPVVGFRSVKLGYLEMGNAVILSGAVCCWTCSVQQIKGFRPL